MEEAQKTILEARIALIQISMYEHKRLKKHTVQVRSVLVARTVRFTVTSFPQAMRIKPVLPFSDLHELFIAVLVIFIVIWTTGIVNIVPILRSMGFCLVLLSLFSTAALSLLAVIESMDVVVLALCCPIRERGLHWGACCHARQFRRNHIWMEIRKGCCRRPWGRRFGLRFLG